MLVRLVFLGSLVACGHRGADPDAGPPGPDADPAEVAGELTILDGGGLGHMWRAPVVFGGFPTDGPPRWYQEVASAGECRVLQYQAGFCDPPCDGLCEAPDVCRPWPTYRSAGSLRIRGLNAPLEMPPEFSGDYLTWGGLPDPLFDPDATVTVDAEGAEIEAFSLEVGAVSRLAIPALDAAGQATLVDGDDLVLAWTGLDPSSRIRVIAHSGGAAHGTPPQTLLECDAEDTGALAIPSALVEVLPAMGLGCAKGRDCAKLGVVRYRRAVTATEAGTVVVMVASGTNYPVMH